MGILEVQGGLNNYPSIEGSATVGAEGTTKIAEHPDVDLHIDIDIDVDGGPCKQLPIIF